MLTNAPAYTAANLETAACLWEAVLDMESDGVTRAADSAAVERAAAIRACREDIGAGTLRMTVVGWTDAVEAAWSHADTAGGTVPGGGEYGEAFDWEFVPDWIIANVDWTGPYPCLRAAPAAVTMPAPCPYATEFPDFPAADIPAAVTGEGWSDLSWHNDAAPFFVNDASGVGVWCDRADAAAREMVGNDRFIATAMEWDGSGWSHDISGGGVLFETNDVEVLTASLPNFIGVRALAHAFALAIEETCADDLDAIRTRNATPAYQGSCASHDFCDANMPMADAFEALHGRPFVPDEGEIAAADLALVNAAWDIARRERLTGGAAVEDAAAPKPAMTLEQFRATATDEASIGDIVDDEGLIGSEGRVYEGLLYLERWTDDRAGIAPPSGPTWLLTLGNEQVTGELADLESKLYDWACANGYCDAAPDAAAPVPAPSPAASLERIAARIRGEWFDPHGDLESDIAQVLREAGAL